MPDEPDNLVLRLLREIRSKQDEHSAKMEDHDKRFDRLDRRLGPMQFQLTHTFGLAGMSNLQAQRTDERVEQVEERQKRFDEMIAEFRRRVAEMEAKLDA